MIREFLDAVHRLDVFLQTRLGRPYHALLGVGLVVEIIKELHELDKVREPAGGIVRTALALLLFAVLLIHQLGELREHAERRGEAARDFGRRK